jgi:hypothetical protein
MNEDVEIRRAVAAEHGLGWREATFLIGEDLETLERSAASLAALLGREREPEREPTLFEHLEVEKRARKRELYLLLTGQVPARDPSSGRFVGFDGGARTSVPVTESHEQTLARVLKTGEANAGHKL